MSTLKNAHRNGPALIGNLEMSGKDKGTVDTCEKTSCTLVEDHAPNI